MKVAIRYYSKGGNTEKLAKAISDVVKVEALDITNKLEDDVDILFLGSSVYAAGVDDKVKEFISNIDVKVGTVVNFSTAAIINSTYSQIKKLLAVKNIPISEKEFHCRGSFGLMHKNRPNEKDLENVRSFAKEIISK